MKQFSILIVFRKIRICTKITRPWYRSRRSQSWLSLGGKELSEERKIGKGRDKKGCAGRLADFSANQQFSRMSPARQLIPMPSINHSNYEARSSVRAASSDIHDRTHEKSWPINKLIDKSASVTPGHLNRLNRDTATPTNFFIRSTYVHFICDQRLRSCWYRGQRALQRYER